MDTPLPERAVRRGRVARGQNPVVREVNYRRLRSPFPVMEVFSADEIAAMHDTALRTLEDLGIRVLLPEARRLFAAAGARVDENTGMVHIGRDIVAAALASAPRSIVCRGGAPGRDVLLEPGCLTFMPGGSAPHATDLDRGRRPATDRDYRELIQLTQHFDVFQMISPLVEPQNVPTNLRHYFTVEAQLTLTDKVPFVYARGTPQVMDSFRMLRGFRGLSEAAWLDGPHCYTIINTNSPRTLDIPMAQGQIDFARNRQLSIVTPFTLMGAMAPITVAGAITLSHAEALSAITLAQLANPGAPVCYGTFTSNVDMRSGAPAFGTPSHFQATLAAGQLARLIGLPWRAAAGSASNANDVQAANENQLGLWGCLLAGATVVIHAAGWLEGGLTLSYEKLVSDAEVLNMIAELCAGTRAGTDEIGFDTAIGEVAPGGHFFAATQTMARYATEFYQPVLHDYANFGAWTERGAQDATTRATAVWKAVLAADARPDVDPGRLDALHGFIRRRTAEGGAPPES